MTAVDSGVKSSIWERDWLAGVETACASIEGDASMIRTILGATTALALFAAGQAAAVQKLPDGTTAEERANTARLNAEQAAKAKVETQTYQAEVAAVAQQEAAARAEFSKETAEYEAEKARVAALSAEERMKWEADVAACKAVDKTRCAPTPAKPKD